MLKTKIFGYDIQYTNLKEFKLLKDDIFINQVYHFKLKKKNPVIFDIGSHIGLSILYFKSIFPNSEIIGFEPNPNVFKILEDNLNVNGIVDVKLHNFAVSNFEGISKLYIDSSNDNWNSNSSLIKGGWTKKEILTPIDVKVEKLSNYINRPIDVLKIDTEGNELDILDDLESKLSLVENIAIEYHPNTPFKPIINKLINKGFKVRYIQNGIEVISPDISKLIIVKGSK